MNRVSATKYCEISKVSLIRRIWIAFTTTGKTTGKATGKTDDLLSLLREQSEATIPEMAAKLELTEDGINYHLRKLQQAGLDRNYKPMEVLFSEIIENSISVSDG